MNKVVRLLHHNVFHRQDFVIMTFVRMDFTKYNCREDNKRLNVRLYTGIVEKGTGA